MITLPSYINIEDFEDFLELLFPPHNITAGTPEETESLRNNLLYTSYYQLYLAFDIDSAPRNSAIAAVHHHAIHIWRTSGSRLDRLDLISQTVSEAGVYQEKYREGMLPFDPIINSLLGPYTRTVAFRSEQLTREMNDVYYYDNVLLGD